MARGGLPSVARSRPRRIASAEAVGHDAVPAGTATNVGSSSRAGYDPDAARRPQASAGQVGPYQSSRHSWATGPASGTPSFSQSSFCFWTDTKFLFIILCFSRIRKKHE